MNTKPIEEAHDVDLRFSHVALVRAAQRARTGRGNRHRHRGQQRRCYRVPETDASKDSTCCTGAYGVASRTIA